MLQVTVISFLVQIIIAEDLPTKTNRTLTWKDALKDCKERFVGPEFLKNCGPASCKVNISKSAQQTTGIQQYWVSGYIQRFPKHIYIGCFRLNHDDYDHYHERKIVLWNNSPGMCLQRCNDTFVYLTRWICLCGTSDRFYPIANKYCNESCTGDTDEMCGVHKSGIRYNMVLSGYKKFQEANIGNELVSETCAVVRTSNKKNSTIIFKNCERRLRYICEKFDEQAHVYKHTCSVEKSTWYDARQNCRFNQQYLWPRTRNMVTTCMNEGEMYWFGQHIKEDIVWGKDLTEGASCLVLANNYGTYSLKLQNCSYRKYALCYPSNLDLSGDTVLEIIVVTFVIFLVLIGICAALYKNWKQGNITRRLNDWIAEQRTIYHEEQQRQRPRRQTTQHVPRATSSHSNKPHVRYELKTTESRKVNKTGEGEHYRRANSTKCQPSAGEVGSRRTNRFVPKPTSLPEEQKLTATTDKIREPKNTTKEEFNRVPNTDFSPTSNGILTVIG